VSQRSSAALHFGLRNPQHHQHLFLADLIGVIRQPNAALDLFRLVHAIQADLLHPEAYRLVTGDLYFHPQPLEYDLQGSSRRSKANLPRKIDAQRNQAGSVLMSPRRLPQRQRHVLNQPKMDILNRSGE